MREILITNRDKVRDPSQKKTNRDDESRHS